MRGGESAPGRVPATTIKHMFVSNSASLPLHGPLVVLGVDPGLTRCGYAILSTDQPQRVVARSMGVLRTSKDTPVPQRLAELADEVSALLDEYSPDAVAVEQVFFQTNVRTAMSVGQASGVVLALAAQRGATVAQYTPSQVKDAVAGWGSAPKEQMQRMVQVRLGLSSPPQPADAADAAAIALCHIACASTSVVRATPTISNGASRRGVTR